MRWIFPPPTTRMMTWPAVSVKPRPHLCVHIIENRLSDFNAALPKRVGKATPVATRDDLTELKESQVLDVCRTANIIGGNVAKVLGEKLTKRYLAAHPSGVSFNHAARLRYVPEPVVPRRSAPQAE